MKKYSTIEYEELRKVGILSINDPPSNRTGKIFFTEFYDLAINHLSLSDISGLVITGTGRHFSCGAEIGELLACVAPFTVLDSSGETAALPAWYVENKAAFCMIHALKIPVVAAINGLCIGSGLELALCAHARICGKGSVLGLPESTFGFLPGLAGTLRYAELLGLAKAMEFTLSGEMLGVEEAFAIGLADITVPKAMVLEHAVKLIEHIAIQPGGYKKEIMPRYISAYLSVCDLQQKPTHQEVV